MSHPRRLPVGIPVQAPPGWSRQTPAAWLLVWQTAALTVLALLFGAIGWVSVDPGSGRPPRPLPSLAALWSRPASPSVEEQPPSDEANLPALDPPQPSKPKQPAPAEKSPPEKPTEKKPSEKKPPEKAAAEKAVEKPAEKPAEKTPPPQTKPVTPSVPALTYQKDIAPILERACVRCHNPNRQQGGVNLSSYEAVATQLMPGKPDASDLLNVIVNGQMPPNMPNAVSDADKKKLRDWIAQGAKQ
jgi:cytochrome c551/c552